MLANVADARSDLAVCLFPLRGGHARQVKSALAVAGGFDIAGFPLGGMAAARNAIVMPPGKNEPAAEFFGDSRTHRVSWHSGGFSATAPAPGLSLDSSVEVLVQGSRLPLSSR